MYLMSQHHADLAPATSTNIIGPGYLPPQAELDGLRRQNKLRDLGSRIIMGLEAHGFTIDDSSGSTTYWEWKRIPC
ncbi:MAG: hypothetical protein JWQ98_1878 [Chlorobi bacterium]|nr:hypothetical protein [Chlorobiota bacterium]